MSIRALQALAKFEIPGAEDDLLVRVPLAGHIALNLQGEVLGVVPYAVQGERLTVLTTRVRGRTSGISANYLVDQSEYICGIYNGPIGDDKPKPQENRRLDKYAAFRAKMEEFFAKADALSIETPAFTAIRRFLASHDPKHPHPILTGALVGRKEQRAAGGDLTFVVDGTVVVETPEARQVLLELALQDLSPGYGTCVVTGRYAPVALGYDGIKGVPNSQSSGAALISNNFEAALPYRLEGNVKSDQTPGQMPTFDGHGNLVMGSASVAPVSVTEMRRQTGALNYMLRPGASDHRFRVGNTVYLFWGNPDAVEDIANLSGAKADPVEAGAKLSKEELRENVQIAMATFSAPHTGRVQRRALEVYLLGLTGAAGRISITHWQEDDGTAMQDRIAAWVDDLAWGAGRAWGSATASGHPWRPTLRALASALIPAPAGAIPGEAIKAARGRLGQQLVLAAYGGQKVPLEVQRIAVHLLSVGDFPGRSGNSTRLSLCATLGAAVLRQTSLTKESIVTQPMYVLGQAFALVEHLQGQLAYAQDSDAQPSIRKLQTFVAGAPRKGYDRVMEAYGIVLNNRSLKPADRTMAEQRMRELLGVLQPVEFPQRSENANLFYLGYHHEESRLWATVEVRIAASKERKAVVAATTTAIADADPVAASMTANQRKSRAATA